MDTQPQLARSNAREAFGVQPLAPLYTIDDLVELYGLSKDYMYTVLKSGDLIGFKLGRAWMVHADDWNSYVDSLRGATGGCLGTQAGPGLA